MLNEYPVLFVDATTGEIIDWDTRPFGSHWNLMKGMEITLDSNRRYEVSRIFLTQISETQPCLIVGLVDCPLKPFVQPIHVEAVAVIYDKLANEALQDESEDSEEGFTYPWESFQNPN